MIIDLLTLAELLKIMPLSKFNKAELFIAPLNDGMEEFDIVTTKRITSFLAQVGYESGQLRYTREIASGAKYEGRKDLGNTERGDGVKFRGRGLIMITGRSNYRTCGHALGVNLLLNPELLEAPALATRSACWFWKTHGCNQLADLGDQMHITRRVNGGENGLAGRLDLFAAAVRVLA